MTRNIITIIVLIVLLGIIGSVFKHTSVEAPDGPSASVSNMDDTAIRTQIGVFGQKLRLISLLAPAAQVKAAMETEYKAFVAPELLSTWETHPETALGRNTSSPYPDRIDVVSIVPNATGYTVEANVIEVASSDPVAPVAVYPITLKVEGRGAAWLITSATKGAYSELPQRVTVEGLWECIPHTHDATVEAHTDECLVGIAKDQSDGHIALDLRLLQTQPVDFPTGTHVHAEGILTPSNQLSSAAWKDYSIDGILSVTSITKI